MKMYGIVSRNPQNLRSIFFINNLPTGFQQKKNLVSCTFLIEKCKFLGKNFQNDNPLYAKKLQSGFVLKFTISLSPNFLLIIN